MTGLQRGAGGFAVGAVFVWAVSALPAATAAQGAIEEVVVTGSYIRRKDSFDSPSPINVIDSVNIAEQGVAAMADIIKNQTFNYGTDFVANATASTFQEGARSFANLRGLGEGATLTLVDGRRTLTGNVNILYPQIAIGRIETLKDGASALYGSDAVAGVVNIIPRKNFEGLETTFWHLQPAERRGNYDETQWNVMFGGGNEQTHLVAAFEYRERGRLRWIDRPDFNSAQFSSSGTGSPGAWLVPTRAADGSLTGGQQRLADPGCGINNGAGGTDKNRPDSFRSGIRNAAGTNCSFEFSQYWDHMPALEGFTGWAFVEHAFNDHLVFEGQFSFSRHQSFGRGSPSNPGGRIGELGIISGNHPGNPFTAMADRGNGLEPLYAQDLDGDGIPDRGPDGAILLGADPFDPSQGISFNEDVAPAALRLVGKQGTRPSGHKSDGSGEGSTSSTDMNFRWAGGLRFDFPNTSWTGEAFYAHQRNILQFPENQAESFSAVADGIAGRLGPNNDQYFNPFSTREHPCANRICDPTAFTQPGDPAFNTLFVMDEVSYQDDTDWRNRFNVADIVFTGDVFDLPAGTVGMALGGQWRRVDLERDLGPIANACDRWVNACGFDFKKGRTTQAVFGEIAVPIMNHGRFGELDLSAAVRYEDSGGGLDSTDPKIGIRWAPRPFMALRASFGSSFIAPSLTQMFDSPVSFLENMVDPTCSLTGDCVDSGSFRTQTFGGNEELQPEAADVWSAGLSLNLLDDRLSISFDYLYFDFQDRISRLRGQDVLDGDAQRFRPFLAGGGTREQWIDPTNKATGNFESQAIVRAPGGEIVEVLTQWVNAQTMKWKGWDLGVSYRWDGTDLPFVDREIGSFNFRVDGTYVQSYEYTLTGLPNETCGNPASGRRPPCEAAGSRNDRTSVVPPAPRIRANGQLNWLMGNHGATVFARYIHHVKEDSVFAAANPPLINSRVTYDAQYSYNIAGLIGGDASSTGFTVGCINCFDTRTDPMLTLGGLETFLHDPRGAMWYVRLSQSF